MAARSRAIRNSRCHREALLGAALGRIQKEFAQGARRHGETEKRLKFQIARKSFSAISVSQRPLRRMSFVTAGSRIISKFLVTKTRFPRISLKDLAGGQAKRQDCSEYLRRMAAFSCKSA
jgi:hypothetical protein